MLCIFLFAQLTSYIVGPLCSSKTPVVRELALTHTLSSGPSARHLPCTGSSLVHLARNSFNIVVIGASSNLLSELVKTATDLLLMNAAATLSYSCTGKCTTSFLRSGNTLCQVRRQGMLETLFPDFRWSVLLTPQICKPSTYMPSFTCFSSLFTIPKFARCCFMLAAYAIFPLMQISSMYA